MTTISGGIIIKERGTSVTYQVKCDRCENIEPSEYNVTLTKGVTEISTMRCSKCGNNQITKIKHTTT